MTDKDVEQDAMIRENAAHIRQNEEAIKRQTAALEQIRDHYYPPPESWWRKTMAFCGKVVCVIVAYLGIAQAVDWIWNMREAQNLAEKYATVAQQLFNGEGDVVGAIACYEKAHALDPGESKYVTLITFMKGMALVAGFMDCGRVPTDGEQARIDAALAEAIVLNKLNPDDPMPNVLIAQAHLLSGEQDDAVKAVKRAIDCAPKRANVRVSACAVLFSVGRHEEARAQLAEAERLDATLPLVSVWKGLIALAVDHDAQAARKWLELTTSRVPRYSLAHLLLGRALLADEKPDLSAVRAAFSRALVLDARLAGAMVGMAETYSREGNFVLARMWLDRALSIDEKYLPALIARARIAAKRGDCALAVADLSAAIALAPFRADIHSLRADAYERQGDAAHAKADREIVAALESASGTVPRNGGSCVGSKNITKETCP